MRESRTLNLTNVHYSSHPYDIWQVLFNYYHELNCPLDHLHNLAVDLITIKRTLDEKQEHSVLIWSCEPGHYMTWLRSYPDASVMTKFDELSMPAEDFVVRCDIKNGVAVFKILHDAN
jgi:hypothetical protein